jgi:penicillin-binding protein 1A
LLRITSLFAAFILAGLLGAAIYLNFNRSNLPDLDGFLRFQAPTMGHIYDSNGHILIELGWERREIIQYRDIPDVLRQAILSAEDSNFFSHSGVDFSVFPRVLSKMNLRALVARAEGSHGQGALHRAAVFPQGGSTITQQLVRVYFLQKLASAENSNTPQHSGFIPRVLAFAFGVPSTNKFLRKVEEIRLSLWIEREMRNRYGSKRRAKEELLARYASFIYLGNGRYGFAAASQYYFGIPMGALTADDADKSALLAGIAKSPGEYAPNAADIQKPTRRRNQILARMVANHFLSAEAARRCQQARILLLAHVAPLTEAPAVVQNILVELKRLGPNIGSDIGIAQLLNGQIQVHSTVDAQVQRIANAALEYGLKLYEQRHPQSAGLIQGSVVVLRNSDAAILAETGGRASYKGRGPTHSDYNRVTQSLRQPGSAMKPILYLAAFRHSALDLDSLVPDQPISVVVARNQPVKWISNFDNQFKGMIPARQALAESRNAAAVWIAEQIGIDSVLQTARDVGIRTRLQPYVTTALGASEVTLLELANAYRVMASGIPAEPHAIHKIERRGGEVVYDFQSACCSLVQNDFGLSMIREGLRGVVRIPSGTAHALDSSTFSIPVMGKTGTTNSYRDALFVGSTYGPQGITVAVRLGFDDNRSLGSMETGGRAALPVFREIMLKVYQEKLAGPVPVFPADLESNIDAYLSGDRARQEQSLSLGLSEANSATDDGKIECRLAATILPTTPCGPPGVLLHPIYWRRDDRGRIIFTNE